MARYTQMFETNGRWTEWVQPIRRGYKMCCCDCGLVHDMDFRIVKGRAQFRASRNMRSTALVRRHKARRAKDNA